MNISFNRGLLIKLAIVLVALVVVYSVFWFFKLGQVEKQINRFVSENSGNISVSDISVSGFPFSQKITITNLRFSLPTPALDKRQVLIATLEASAGIFQSEYVVTIQTEAAVFDDLGNQAKLIFNAAPQITVAIADGLLEKLNYQDSGYKILDASQKQIYAAAASSVSVESSIDENEQIIFKISADVSAIEGFGVENVYKNAFERKIINALKTGELALGSSANQVPSQEITPENTASAAIINSVPNDLSSTDSPVAQVVENSNPNQVATAQATNPVTTPEVAVVQEKSAENIELPMPTNSEAVVSSINNESDLEKIPTQEVVTAQTQETDSSALAMPLTVKSNFSMNVEYVLMPNQVQHQNPLDVSQMQETPLQYSKLIRINNFKFSNENYEISVNGNVSIFSDDSLPSGGISIQVSKFNDALKNVVSGLRKLAKKTMVENEIKPVDLTGVSDPNAPDSVDMYQALLQRIALNLNNVALEVASKNPVSKDEIAQFDIRREKNLELLVNETSVREILGKF
jgi:hypothetical protein